MFLLVYNSQILDFWGNRPGDTFLENTMEKLNLDKQAVELYYIPTLIKAPAKENCELSDGKLNIKGLVNIWVDEAEVTEETIIATHELEAFYYLGLYHRPC